MNLNYRILDCDLFESYMALEGWENFPYLRKLLDEDGSLGFMMQDFSFMIFDFTPSGNLLKAICMYQVFGDTLSIQYFEVSKEYRKMGVGSAGASINTPSYSFKLVVTVDESIKGEIDFKENGEDLESIFFDSVKGNVTVTMYDNSNNKIYSVSYSAKDLYDLIKELQEDPNFF